MLKLDWNLLFTIINLVVLYFLLRKFLIKPISGIIEKRQSMINGGLKEADKAKEEASKLKTQYENSLQTATQESAEILEDARKKASEEKELIIKAANEQAAKIKQTAKDNMETERENTRKQLETEIASLAMAAATKIVLEGASKETNQAMYNQFLEKVGGANGSSNH
ncbi:MAG: F0F1 ATP synthase subunit B [Lachnospiraceae bacterium]|nr:F0F1 ATP synthase subunit B [Lachnospiraceae bacterium]MDD3615086.1 F0F1 ATP synthase subunit B [Lachnospiraceae bacterium]